MATLTMTLRLLISGAIALEIGNVSPSARPAKAANI